MAAYENYCIPPTLVFYVVSIYSCDADIQGIEVRITSGGNQSSRGWKLCLCKRNASIQVLASSPSLASLYSNTPARMFLGRANNNKCFEGLMHIMFFPWSPVYNSVAGYSTSEPFHVSFHMLNGLVHRVVALGNIAKDNSKSRERCWETTSLPGHSYGMRINQ